MRVFTAIAAIVATSGAAYFWMKYMLHTDDPLAVVNHPLQPSMLHLHVLAAPVFLFMVGVLFNSHVARRIGKTIPNRRSGILALGTIAAMTVSGYALQVVTGAGLQRVWLVVHLGSGALFALAYVTHLAISVRLWAAGRCDDSVAA
jgi:hypothetical protein